MLSRSSEASSEIYFCLYEQKAAEASGGGEGRNWNAVIQTDGPGRVKCADPEGGP